MSKYKSGKRLKSDRWLAKEAEAVISCAQDLINKIEFPNSEAFEFTREDAEIALMDTMERLTKELEKIESL